MLSTPSHHPLPPPRSQISAMYSISFFKCQINYVRRCSAFNYLSVFNSNVHVHATNRQIDNIYILYILCISYIYLYVMLMLYTHNSILYTLCIGNSKSTTIWCCSYTHIHPVFLLFLVIISLICLVWLATLAARTCYTLFFFVFFLTRTVITLYTWLNWLHLESMNLLNKWIIIRFKIQKLVYWCNNGQANNHGNPLG